MNCPSCLAENPAGARFCMECCSALGMSCPSCGLELPGGALFCFQSGHRLGEQNGGPAVQPAPAAAPFQQYLPDELRNKLESARASGGLRTMFVESTSARLA